MHALTRPMSEMYCWQSRIASGSQAARCCGVHCCAAAGQDANMSARPSSTAAAAAISRNFNWALRMSIIALHLISVRHLLSIQRPAQAALPNALRRGDRIANLLQCECPLLALSGHTETSARLSAFGDKADMALFMDAKLEVTKG